MKKQEEFASDIVFKSVYHVSEDMLKLVHRIVAENSRYDMAFRHMAATLEDVTVNLKKHIMASKKINRGSKRKVQKKIDMAKGLVSLCIGYANKCKKIADELVDLTEKLEKDKKMQAIIANLIQRLEEETEALKKSQEAGSIDESEDPDCEEEPDEEESD